MVSTDCGFRSAPDGSTQGADLLVYFGPTIQTEVGFDPAWTATGKALPKLGTPVAALVDTGATESCIDALLAAKLGLPIVDRRKIAGAGGVHEVNVYLAQIRVVTLNVNIHGSFAGVNLKDGGQQHSVLLGRTFLRHVTMLYDGKTGKVTISHDPTPAPPAAPAPIPVPAAP